MVTTSVCPFRRAQPMNVVLDAVVQPIFPPRSPRYVSSIVFWLYRVIGLWCGLSGKRMVRSLLVVHELRDGERLPGEQRLVVGGHVLSRPVEAVRQAGHRVVGLQVMCLGVHHRDALGDRAGRLGDRQRGVVGGDQQHRLEQVGYPVSVPGEEPDLARHGVGGPAGGDHGRVRVEHRHQGDRGQHLERARGQVPAMRVLGGQHLPGAGVGEDVGGGLHLGQWLGLCGGIVRRSPRGRPVAARRPSPAPGPRRRPGAPGPGSARPPARLPAARPPSWPSARTPDARGRPRARSSVPAIAGANRNPSPVIVTHRAGSGQRTRRPLP